jgi:hypothetical protein
MRTTGYHQISTRIIKKVIIHLVFILHLSDGHGELSHCPTECIEKSIEEGKEQYLFMNACFPK